MVRPCVARGFHRSVGFAVLYQCIRPLIGACCAPGHHGYQRTCGLISGQASNGPFGSPGFAGAGKTSPPSRFILSQTSAGKTGLCHRALRDHFCRSTIAPRRSKPTTWNEFLPISMPIVAMVAIDLLDMAGLRSTLAPSQHHSPVGQEHGRTIPLTDLGLRERRSATDCQTNDDLTG